MLLENIKRLKIFFDSFRMQQIKTEKFSSLIDMQMGIRFWIGKSANTYLWLIQYAMDELRKYFLLIDMQMGIMMKVCNGLYIVNKVLGI